MDTSDNTFFKDVYKLPAGHYMKISSGDKVVSPKNFTT
jgi:asparagine synthetase B (glutamine-hydrolysing)